MLALGLVSGPMFFPRTVAQTPEQTASRLYQLEFVQESNCPYGSYLFPWSVALDNSTVVVEPSNATPPVTWGAESHLTSDVNYSAIVFSVPSGEYNYSIAPTNPFSREQSGSVTVAGSDVQVEVWAFITAMGCDSTTSTPSAMATTTVVSTYVSTSVSTSISPTTNSAALYGVMAVALIFVVATGYFAARGRKPTS
jgi:hypothetical protein